MRSETSLHLVLRRELEELAREAGRALRGARRRRALAHGLEQAAPYLLIVPAAWLLLRLLLTATSVGSMDVSGWWAVPATLIPPLFVVGSAWVGAHLEPVDRRDALAALDRELGLAERLLTADEFLATTRTSAFVEAALEDASRVAPAAHEAVLRLGTTGWTPARRDLQLAGLSALLLVLAGLFGGGPSSARGRDALSATRPDSLAALDPAEREEATNSAPDEELAPRPAPRAGAERAKKEPASARRDTPGELSDETKESAGKTGEGRSSDAQSSSGASESRGMPSNQSQESKAGAKKPQKPSAKKPKPPADLKPTEQKDAEENSGSTAGKGSSKGSNRNPAVSKWSSKDQVTSEDDQEIEEDEETEDEEERQESRGGMQPSLRDRKPPVSRDLRIGFGNQKNPDANGRGGPSEAKKSRGTASLVLGVPIPDRVKGQPNPGKTKITQERIEPKPEEPELVEAAARLARSAPSGHLRERELTPWMRTLVREYFLTLRQDSSQP